MAWPAPSSMDPQRSIRILHAPWNIAGNPIGLSRGERELGFESDVMVLEQHRFGYEADFDLAVGSRADLRAKSRRATFALRALARYDVFHYNFGQTIYHSLDSRGQIRTELPWLRRLGKRVLATFQGNDARPPSAVPFAAYTDSELAWLELVQTKRRELMLRHADRVFYLNPDLRRWLPGGEFRPYASIDPRAITPSPVPEREEMVVAHAPSDRHMKGTDHVISAVERLRTERLPIRLDLIENVTREEALSRTAAADVAVDQLNIGWYGGYAVEAMALGRPVLCRIEEAEAEDNPIGEELPIVRTSSETLAADLRALLEDLELRRRLGARSRAFVERHHDPRRVALRNLEGLVPIPGERTSVAATPPGSSPAAGL